MKKEKWDNFNELDLVDNYIKSERGIEPDPSLVSKLISTIEAIEQSRAGVNEIGITGANEITKSRNNQIFMSALYRVAIAASIALILFLGVSLGSSFKGSVNYEMSVNINDNQMENLHIYTADE
ncbi:MAG TPA: hypothetical protein DEO54_11285 [Rikenellaceae bacterium]|nr:MAG: hypothetical protein A2X20_11335 [Bacteroidetes bacterium GWE2_40_15]HBZ26793.1 hypothetical protein [Rikenellaceae bacterium]